MARVLAVPPAPSMPALAAPISAAKPVAAGKPLTVGLAGGGGVPQPSEPANVAATSTLPAMTAELRDQAALDEQAAKSQLASTPQQLALANGLSPLNTLYVTVSTDDLAAADGQVRSFFKSNAIPFQAMVQPAAAGNGAAMRPLFANAVSAYEENQNAPLQNAKDQRLVQSGGPGEPVEHLYFARNLPRETAQQLRVALSTERMGQTAVISDSTIGSVQNIAMANVSPSTRPTTQPATVFKAEDSLRVTVDQLVGPGVEKTNTVQVATDGTISLPMIEPVAAGGSTAEELGKRIADKYREANLIPDAKVSVALATPTTPTTQPVATTEPATTEPTAAAAATTQPTTQPTEQAAATTQPDVTDVVVVLRNGPTPTTEPTTQQ